MYAGPQRLPLPLELGRVPPTRRSWMSRARRRAADPIAVPEINMSATLQRWGHRMVAVSLALRMRRSPWRPLVRGPCCPGRRSATLHEWSFFPIACASGTSSKPWFNSTVSGQFVGTMLDFTAYHWCRAESKMTSGRETDIAHPVYGAEDAVPLQSGSPV